MDYTIETISNHKVIKLTRLILEGKNIKFEDLPSTNQSLSFNILEQELKKHIHIDTFNIDTLKSLNLYSNNQYNNAAAILSDNNNFPGIDIIKFGSNINTIQKRITFDHISILEVYKKTVEVFQDYYQYEIIEDIHRKTIERIPEIAFREAIANSLIHRLWDIKSQIRISMYDDKIDIVSPGGLPSSITVDEYLNGRISYLRNYTIAQIFYRLHLVEIFGTGISRIKQLYENSLKKPIFEVTENSITITLPILEETLNISIDEQTVYNILSQTSLKSISEIMNDVPYGKSKTTTILKRLIDKGYVQKEGNGKGTKYKRL